MAMTFTYDDSAGSAMQTIIATWTSDASGDASGTTKKITGEIIKGVTDPGTAAPTDNYDITITDERSVNVLGQSQDDLADRDTSTTEQVYFVLKNYDATPIGVSAFPVVNDVLTIAVANAGNAKDGVLYLYVRRL